MEIEKEIRDWQYAGIIASVKKTRWKIECPFCGKVLLVSAKKFSAVGKKCNCGAKLYNSGAGVKIGVKK